MWTFMLPPTRQFPHQTVRNIGQISSKPPLEKRSPTCPNVCVCLNVQFRVYEIVWGGGGIKKCSPEGVGKCVLVRAGRLVKFKNIGFGERAGGNYYCGHIKYTTVVSIKGARGDQSGFVSTFGVRDLKWWIWLFFHGFFENTCFWWAKTKKIYEQHDERYSCSFEWKK